MKHLYHFTLLLFALIFFACNGRAQKKLAIIGSSTSQCFVVGTDSCYVTRLQNYYSGMGMPVTLDNKAMAGDDCYRGMPNGYTPPPGRNGPAPDRNITAALAGNPDVVLINYPSNGYNVMTVSEAMNCLRIMKQTANAAGKPCYITTTQPRWGQGSYPDYFPSFNTPAVKQRMDALKDSILNEFGPFAINFWNGLVNTADTTILPQYDSGDSTHFNAAGHGVLANRVIAKSIFNTALPVSFTSFSAYISNRQTFIQWTTDPEQDIRSYQVQRSDDGATFSMVREIAARHQSAKNSYSVTDPSPAAASSFYRVVAIGFNAQPSYTRVVKVVNNGASFVLQKIVVSSPSVKAELHAAESQPVTLQLLNGTGQVLLKLTATLQAGFNTIALPASLPGSGVYFLRIFNSRQEAQIKSFIKQ